MALNAGYIGLCEIDGLKIRVSSFNLNVRQEVQFYDHIIGLRDSIPTGLKTKKDDGNLNIQKTFWRPGVKIAAGGITFPATVKNLQKIYDLAKTGDDFTIKFTYSCKDVERTFRFCKINSFIFTSVAGEIATIQIDVMSRDMKESTNKRNLWTKKQKLLTWDEINVTSISADPVQQFTFAVNNNCMPIYTAGANDTDGLFPKVIRVGMQQVTGTIVYYVRGVSYDDIDDLTSNNNINIKSVDNCDGVEFNEDLCVIYKPIERASSMTALLHTLPFVGVGNALGA
jgi:hypothetical protein